MAPKRPPVIDRRRATRPKDGDVTACPACGALMRFHERYTITTGSRTDTQPAWVCRCGDETFVRVLAHDATPTSLEPALRTAFIGSEALRRTLSSIRAGAIASAKASVGPSQRAHRLVSGLNRSTDLAVLVADDHARYLAANATACAMTGYHEAELLKMTVWQLSAPSQDPPAERLWRLFLTDGIMVGRYRLLRKSGEIVSVDYAAATHVLPGIHVSVLVVRPDGPKKALNIARDRRLPNRSPAKRR